MSLSTLILSLLTVLVIASHWLSWDSAVWPNSQTQWNLLLTAWAVSISLKLDRMRMAKPNDAGK
jgi:hypothetical protein